MKKFYLRFVNVFLALVLAAQTATPVFAIADGDKAETLPALPITELTEGENTNPESTLPTADLADAENVISESTLPTTDLTDAEEIQFEHVLPMTDLTDAEPQPEPATPPAQNAEEENNEITPAPSADAEGGENIEKAPAQPLPELAEAKTIEAENKTLTAVPANTYPITTQVIGGKATVHVDKTKKQGEDVTINITDFTAENNKYMHVTVHSISGSIRRYRVGEITEGVPNNTKRFQFKMPDRAVIVKVEFQNMISIVEQPSPQTVTAGDTAVFTINTKGLSNYDRHSYQWQTIDNRGDWRNIEGATQNFYPVEKTTLDDNGKQFRCIVTCEKCYYTTDDSTIISDPATLAVLKAQPTDINITAVQDLQPITVRYTARIFELNLPKEVTVTLSDNSQKQLAVAWDTSNYDNYIPDIYILIGNLLLQRGITNTKQLTAKIKVTVSEEDDPGHSFRDDLIVGLEAAYDSFSYIPYKINERDTLIKAILEAEAVLDKANPTSRDYISASREVEEAAKKYSPNYRWTDPEDPDRSELDAWVRYAPKVAEICLFTQDSRDRFTDKAKALQFVLNNPDAITKDWSDAYKALIQAVDSLERVRATGYPGKSGLKNLIRFAREKAEDSKYTQATRYELNKAIQVAQAVAGNAKASSDEVSVAEWAIRDAIDLLEEKPYKPSRGGGGGSRRRGGSSGSSGGGSSDGGNYVQPQTETIWDINNSLTKSKYGINVTINADDKLSTAFLNELIANKNKSVTLKGAWYNWDFYGTSIENTMPGVVWFDTTISTVTPNQAQISKLTGKNDTTVLHFAHQGKLAGKTKITVDIDKYANKKMFVYQYNAAKARLELVQANVSVNANGVMAFTITEGADYIISPTAIKGAVIIPKPVAKPVKKTEVKPVPKK